MLSYYQKDEGWGLLPAVAAIGHEDVFGEGGEAVVFHHIALVHGLIIFDPVPFWFVFDVATARACLGVDPQVIQPGDQYCSRREERNANRFQPSNSFVGDDCL